jgi:phosphoribosyl 1,2-cyclic phosphate phosphodiesterase
MEYMQAQFLFLGTGGSAGVPVIGCSCAVCRSGQAQNRRLRSSGLIRIGDRLYLLDVGPDFREQALRYDIRRLDGVLLTHAHFDHIGGLDDLRVFYYLQKRALPCVLSQDTFEELGRRYHYMMSSGSSRNSTCAQLDFRVLPDDFGKVTFEGLSLDYLSYYQAGMKVTGFRLKNFAYVSDIREFSDEVFSSLKGVSVLVLSALRHVSSEMHFSLDEAVDFARRIGAEKTYFTHIAHDLDYAATNALLPPDIRLSYDGLEISFEVEGKS